MDQPTIDLSQIKEPTVPKPGRKEEKEEDALITSMERENKMNATIHACKRALLVVSFVIIIVFILIRVFTLVAPSRWL